MDWKWVWLILLLLVIAAAVWLLLRRPGGSDQVSGTGDPALRPDTDADNVPPSQTGGGYAAGAPVAAPAPPADDQFGGQQAGAAPYDQAAQEPGGYPEEPAVYEQAAAEQSSSEDPDYGQSTEVPAADYSQEASYTDTATGETTQADTVYDDGSGPAAEPTTEPDYTETTTVTEYEGTTPDGSGYTETSTVTEYEETASPDTGYAQTSSGESTYTEAPTGDSTYTEAPTDDAAYQAAAPETQDAGDYGYDEAHAGAAAGNYAQGPFGAGSAEPAEDGSGPAGWSIKGNAGSMLFHTPDSPSYEGARAEVWFESEEAARAAGFAHWDRKQR